MTKTSTVVFEPGELRKCENFTIVDDEIEEATEEDFTVVIETVDPDSVVPEVPSTIVRIVDDDSRF